MSQTVPPPPGGTGSGRGPGGGDGFGQPGRRLPAESGDPVRAIGGFNGTDPSPSLAELQDHVRQGQIHYFIAGAGRFGGRGFAAIAAWVEQNFTATTIGGTTVCDLTASD
jgi:hypothetical protein